MIRHKFVLETSREYGSRGLRLLNRPHFDPLGGMAVAHDMLEHFQYDDGSIEHEIMALSAGLHVRGFDADQHLRNARVFRRPAENISSEMPSQCHYARDQDKTELLDPGNTKPIADDMIEEEIQHTWRLAKRLVIMEFAGEEELYTWILNEQRFVGWMRKGYRKAVKRYRGISPHMLAESFVLIERKADSLLVEYDTECFEGIKITFTIDPRRAYLETVVHLEDEMA